MGSLLTDLRFGLRMLRRNPGFAAIATVTLALGIGANTAMFSVLNAVVLQPLPYADPERLVAIQARRDGRAVGVGTSLADFEDWRKYGRGFASMGTFSFWTFNMVGRGEPLRILGARVSGDVFAMLGTPALLGRTVLPADDRAEAVPVAVLGHGLWRRVFGGDPRVLGTTATLNGIPHTIVGVMPPGFAFPSAQQDLWAPLANEMTGGPRDARFLVAVGRLAPGVSIPEAQTSLDVVAGRLAAAFPGTNRGWGAHIVSLHESIVGDVRPALLVLSGAVGFVLLIACANVSNLLLSRATFRRRELALRVALGATGGRIARQLVVENLTLAVSGGLVGLILAPLATAALRRFGPANIPRLANVGLDASVFAFAAVVSLATGIVLALVPARQAARARVREALAEGDRTASAVTRSHLRRGLVVAETALALTLLVGGALLIRSFHNLMAVPLGFEAERLVSASVFLAPPRYVDLASQRAFVRNALAATESLPGVASAAMASQLPMAAGPVRLKFAVEGRPTDRADAPSGAYVAVSASYFRTMAIPLRAGRLPAESDSESAPPIVVVNETMARLISPAESPLGRRVAWIPEGDPAQGKARWHTVVGVVGDVKSRGLDANEGPAGYVPYPQRVLPFVRSVTIVARASGEPAPLLAALSRAIHGVDPQQPAFDARPVLAVVSRSVESRRFITLLLQGFAGLAFVLSMIGIYGVLSYTVGQRTREIGIRMALGAESRGILRLVIGDGLGLALTGVALGLPLAATLARSLQSLLFGVTPWDPATLAALSVGLALSAALACALPARRAMRVNPIVALRRD